MVTPELGETRYFSRPGKRAPCAKAGGMADFCAVLVDALQDSGVEVHVAMPDYRGILPSHAAGLRNLHLCPDQEFDHRKSVYDGGREAMVHGSLAFQREVIRLLPEIRPDVVHCHDWMTGLVPAVARELNIPCVFTLQNLHDHNLTLRDLEAAGIDARDGMWRHLFYQHFPAGYETTRDFNFFSPLASGIHAADFVTVVGHGFLEEINDGRHPVPGLVREAIRGKHNDGRAHGILNALPDTYRPENDPHVCFRYDAASHVEGKRRNKREAQRRLGLEINESAPMLFWPSRLDPAQKGCHLLAEILHSLITDYADLGLQVVFVADGSARGDFEHIVKSNDLENRVVVTGFSEELSRLAYAASDFTLMPSAYEPCGLSQLAGMRYGSLPVVHGTGGLRDTVFPMDGSAEHGNGFVFETYHARAFRAVIDDAMRFFIRPDREKMDVISRVMRRAAVSYSPTEMIGKFQGVYDDAILFCNDGRMERASCAARAILGP
ncbi:MAG: glycogen/starch synthase [Verrucomicrobiota bacterium]